MGDVISVRMRFKFCLADSDLRFGLGCGFEIFADIELECVI